MTEDAAFKRKAKILDRERMERAVVRMAHEIAESERDLSAVALVGIRTRGVPLAQRLAATLERNEGTRLLTGSLDITLYRDDLSTVAPQPLLKKTELDFDITGKVIVLCDDVLFTGRTIRAAMDALIDFGRPKAIQLAVLVDRGHRELPIRPDFVGKNLPTRPDEDVQVRLEETDGEDAVVLGETAEGEEGR
jgi:pyrimidine operon attenuation protein/uracil phosphoribosyltransferase